MPTPTDLLDTIIDEVPRGIREIEAFLRQVPGGPAAPLIPALIPAAGITAGALTAVLLWVTPDLPELTPQRAAQIRKAVDTLTSNQAIGAGQLSRALAGVPDTVRVLGQAYKDQERRQPAPVDTSTPAQIQRQAPGQLARTVAVQETWRKAHHGQVHERLAEAETSAYSDLLRLGTNVTQSLIATVHAIRSIVEIRFPELRRELVTELREEAQVRREVDRDIRSELRERAERLAERIGDVVRWLRTEALPELRDQVRAEIQARREAQRELAERIERARERSIEADHELRTQLQPITAWLNQTGRHTSEKVRRTEGVFDQLLRSGDLNWAAQLLVAGPFVVLVQRILSRVIGQVPDVLGGLEDAAARAIGAVD